jgi:CubicO group peptidase (beta-lactamase class C family)
VPDQLTATLAAGIATWPGPATAGVVSGEGVQAISGPAERAFPWASVTKLLVALACLIAWEEGTLDMGDAVGPPGSTLAHVLAHASGLPFEGVQPLAPPARRRIYSNTGIELAAKHLEARSGMHFGDYLQIGVLSPLAMSGTLFEGSPAYGASGPLVDLLALAGELLSPTLVSRMTLQAATSVAWPGLAGVLPGFGRQDPCDWGLGPEIRGLKSPHWTGARNSPVTFGHFGQSGSLLWVDPAAGLAVAGLCGTDFGPWATEAWPALSDAVLSHAAIPPAGAGQAAPAGG